MADIKWSAFPSTAGAAVSGDTLVGLHSGANYQFGITATPTALAITQWDANKNLSANNLLSGYATTATAAATTVLTVASAYRQYFTGSTTQTVTMPVTSTLVLGQSYLITNLSSGVVTVQSSGANTIQAMAANSALLITCILTSGTTAASWDFDYSVESAGVTSITGTANQVIASSATGNVTLSLPQSIATSSSPTFAGVTAGSVNISGNTLISTGTNQNITITPNGTGEVLLGIGTAVSVAAGFFTQITNNLSTGNSLLVSSFDNLAVSGAIYGALKSRSTVVNSFVALQANDVIGGFVGYGDTGFTYRSCGGMILACAASPSSGIMPTQLTFSTQNAAGSTTTALTISDAQIVTLANALPVGSGGLGITTTPSNGFIPIGNGTNYISAAITPGNGISITNGSGSITISSTGASPWVDQTTSSVTMAVNTGYTSDAGASLVTFTLPATSAIGDWIEINGKGSGLFSIAQATGQQINFASNASTSGAGGSVSSILQFANIRLRCITANTIWTVVSSVTNFTIV